MNVDMEHIEAAQMKSENVVSFSPRYGVEDPAVAAGRAQARQLLERAIDQLPEAFRIVFLMREIEGCTVEETAVCLDLRSETVKTRLHRARRLLRAQLKDTLAATMADAFPFLGARCDHMTDTVMKRLNP